MIKHYQKNGVYNAIVGADLLEKGWYVNKMWIKSLYTRK